MKKVLLALTVVAGLAMTSCGGADMCACSTEMMELGKKFQEDPENEDLKKEFEAKAKVCEEMGKTMQEGKSEEEIEAMGKELMENCDAFKDMGH